MPHPATLDPDRLLAECDVRFLRRSGPGGQNRNKVETAVVLTHRPTGLAAEANERRSQSENRRAALFRLRIGLALAVRTPAGERAGPSPSWMARCRDRKLAINPAHDNFPAILAEALDEIASKGWKVAEAAEALCCSASQLTKLLKHEPRAIALVNDRRAGLGLRPLL